MQPGGDAVEEEHDSWLILASVEGVGPHTFARLLGRHGSAARVLRLARAGRLEARMVAEGGTTIIPRETMERLTAAAREPATLLEPIQALELKTTTLLDVDYPRRLRELDPPPPVIFGWGDLGLLDADRSVAVVGTRRPTPAGRAHARQITARLCERGAVVVSGLAVGIDGVAHATAVEEGGRTVAVIGGGHEHPGPRAHRQLRAAMLAAGGAVVSELPPSAVPSRGSFPRRNRLISVLSDAVVVVEAPVRSGALITARHALEQGRNLFVAPGRVGETATGGCLALLRETPARIIVGPEALMEDLGYGSEATSRSPGRRPESRPTRGPGRSQALAALGDAERTIALHLAAGPSGHDALVVRTGLSPGVVASALVLLQIRGLAQCSDGTYLAAGSLLSAR